MSLSSLISRVFGTERPAPERRISKRSLDAAKTNRLNQAHWTDATNKTINEILGLALETIRTRCIYEASNNPNVEGAIKTFCDDVVGRRGPKLQVVAGPSKAAKAYSARIEASWYRFWKRPDLNGQMSGPEMLRLMIRQLWTCGESLAQKVSTDEGMRLLAIHPRRLSTPYGYNANSIILGVERTATGKPVRYHIQDESQNSEFVINTRWVPVDAKNIIHIFDILEPGQARGLPWLASCLQPIADLRDYDDQVMDAARVAADMAILLYARDPGADFKQFNETFEVERRSISTIPPGYEPWSNQPAQPANTYVEFRAEKLRELGRPRGIPLMMLQLDSRNHNYSSARFDSQIYQRGIQCFQDQLVEKLLDRVLADVMREEQLQSPTAKAAEDLEVNWIWPTFPHVDPNKEATAALTRMQSGVSTLRDECAALNRDYEDVIRQLGIERDKFEELNLPVPYMNPQILQAALTANATADAQEAQPDAEQQ